MAKRKLGRGLRSLLGRQAEPVKPSEEVLHVAVEQIAPNPWQPRTPISREALQGLVESIRENGVLQPIIVRRHGDKGYEVVAGERRWRAALEAGVTEIPAVVRAVPDDRMLLLALVENLQREDLNPIERARGYVTLMKNASWTQEELANHLSLARATVANTVRLLELPEEIQDLVSRGTITAGHGRALLALQDESAQKRLCQQIIKESLSVRQTEDIVSGARPRRSGPGVGLRPPAHIRELEERLSTALGAKVTVKERKKGGKIIIEFSTHDDFDRILAIIEREQGDQAETEDFHV